MPISNYVIINGFRMTQKQYEVLGLLMLPLSNKEIVDRLCVAPTTFDTHKKRLFSIFDVHGSRELVAVAYIYGFKPAEEIK